MNFYRFTMMFHCFVFVCFLFLLFDLLRSGEEKMRKLVSGNFKVLWNRNQLLLFVAFTTTRWKFELPFQQIIESSIGSPSWEVASVAIKKTSNPEANVHEQLERPCKALALTRRSFYEKARMKNSSRKPNWPSDTLNEIRFSCFDFVWACLWVFSP